MGGKGGCRDLSEYDEYAVRGVTGTGYDQCPVNVDRALMTVTHGTDFLQNGSNWVRAYS